MTFEKMFKTIHGYAPFPWQSRAAKKLLSKTDGFSVDVPTASGKTAMIDAGVYAAVQNGIKRIVFIINRRVVVDEAYSRAKKIAQTIKAKIPELSQKIGPIKVVRLRGGVFGDDDWVLYPDHLTIIVSTIDQVGSRLLHRGYGVSPRMAPMHAGFLGSKALFVVDEAHIAMPFCETVEACQRYGADIRLVAMTATPVTVNQSAISLDDSDRLHPVLKKRLEASKQIDIVRFSTPKSNLVKAAVAEALKLSENANIVGIIVNRVLTARKVLKILTTKKKPAVLLTGRNRSYNRDRLMQEIFPKIRAGRDRKKANPLFVVATQTIEVGADIDFDAMVSEVASLNALRQRFSGRLDRLGELGLSHGVILIPESEKNTEEMSEPRPDRVYGMEIYHAVKWIGDRTTIDFGILKLDEVMAKTPPPEAPVDHAPGLLPAHLTILSQTGVHFQAVDVSPWLHGVHPCSPDVSIVWRADLHEKDITNNSDNWKEAVKLKPPLTQEMLEVPIYAVHAWLKKKRNQDFSDVEGAVHRNISATVKGSSVLRWRGAEEDEIEIITADKIRPGDTIVVPASYGGCDRYGWDPGNKNPVEDVGDRCSLERGRGHVVRLAPGLMGWLKEKKDEITKAVEDIMAAEIPRDPNDDLDIGQIKSAHAELRRMLEKIDNPLIAFYKNKYEIELHPYGVVLRGHVLEEIGGTFSGCAPVDLEDHLQGVAAMAKRIAGEHSERKRIIRAAEKHDLGKAEPRFQIMLHGNPFSAETGPLLAKSGFKTRSEKHAAYINSGLPKGFRHELASIDKSDETDDLVRYLVGTHHGFGRPWFTMCEDDDAPGGHLSHMDGGWLSLFQSLQMKYNPWGLAGMELILRAADARQSMEEHEPKNV